MSRLLLTPRDRLVRERHTCPGLEAHMVPRSFSLTALLSFKEKAVMPP